MLSATITSAKFRPATLYESQQAKGYAPYRIGSFICDSLWKITGTVDMYLKGEDTRTWEAPYLQKFADKFWVWNGYNESNFLKTRYNVTGKRYSIENEKKICGALLSHHRNDDIFNNNVLTTSLLEMIQEASSEEITFNDMILGCDPENTTIYHRILHKSLNQESIKQFNLNLKIIVNDTLSKWRSNSSLNPIEITRETSLYAARNFTLLLFGEELASEELSQLISFINTFVIKRGMRTLSKDKELEFKQKLKQLGETISRISEQNIPVFRGVDLTSAQKKSMIFTLLFAGQETTSALLSHILWKLASNLELQEELYHQIKDDSSIEYTKIPAIKKLFTQSMQEFTPAYMIPRLFKVDTCLEYTQEGDETPKNKVFFKGESIAVRIDKIAMLMDAEGGSVSKWFGFGSAPHFCPGDKLAIAEISELIAPLIKEYRISTTQTSVETAGQVSLVFVKPIHITLSPR